MRPGTACKAVHHSHALPAFTYLLSLPTLPSPWAWFWGTMWIGKGWWDVLRDKFLNNTAWPWWPDWPEIQISDQIVLYKNGYFSLTSHLPPLLWVPRSQFNPRSKCVCPALTQALLLFTFTSFLGNQPWKLPACWSVGILSWMWDVG